MNTKKVPHNLEFHFLNSSWVCVIGLNEPVIFSSWCKAHGLELDPSLTFARGGNQLITYSIKFCPNLIKVTYYDN